jgi:hypothetical protein
LKKNTGVSGITVLPIFAYLRTRVKRRQLRPAAKNRFLVFLGGGAADVENGKNRG